MKKQVFFVLCLMAGGSILYAAQLSSDAFPYRYEADVLPSDSVPAYTYSSSTGMLESDFASVSNGILKLNTDTNGVPNEAGWYTLIGGEGTVWNPPYAGPCTMEVRMRSLPNNSTTYNAWFYWFDGNSAILLQVWNNKVSLNSVEVTGMDNQTDFHTYRIVSDAYGASADQRFDLYRDGVLIIDDAPNVADFRARQVMFGDMTGVGEINVEIDYIRWDDQNAWIPDQCGVKGYLKGDVNRDCLVDMEDVAVFARGWLYSTDPEDMLYIDCSDPQNVDLCR